MDEKYARKLVGLIRKWEGTRDVADITDDLVWKYEIGYSEAVLLFLLSKTNFQ